MAIALPRRKEMKSSASIGVNIAEGSGRRSEICRFLRIARGSASELEYRLLLAKDSHLLEPDTFENMDERAREI